MWRHGDVLIAAISELPANARLRLDGVLARGEQTGHMHRIAVPESAELWELDGELFMRVITEKARIVHEEHQPIELPRGVYRVWQQREYTPEKIRRITD